MNPLRVEGELSADCAFLVFLGEDECLRFRGMGNGREAIPENVSGLIGLERMGLALICLRGIVGVV